MISDQVAAKETSNDQAAFTSNNANQATSVHKNAAVAASEEIAKGNQQVSSSISKQPEPTELSTSLAPAATLGGRALSQLERIIEHVSALPTLSAHPATRKAQIADIIKQADGNSSSTQAQRNKALLAAHQVRKAARLNEGLPIQKITIVGAGPTGLIQALKAYSQGIDVTLLEKRSDFERHNIFQIEDRFFNDKQTVDSAELGSLLTPDTVKYFEKLGIIKTEKINEQFQKFISIADLQNVLTGVVDTQTGLQGGIRLKYVDHNISLDEVQNTDTDAIFLAVGAGYPRTVFLKQLAQATTTTPAHEEAPLAHKQSTKPQTQAFINESNRLTPHIKEISSNPKTEWSNTPHGFVLLLRNQSVSSSATELESRVDQLKADLRKAYPDSDQLNILSLPEQGAIQLNFALNDDQFSQWLSTSPRSEYGGLDWNKKDETRQAHLSLLDALLSNENISEPTRKFLIEALQGKTSFNPSGWVSEDPISHLKNPATVIASRHQEGKQIPVAFIGDSAGNNWFLIGDGHAREHDQTTVVANQLLNARDIPDATAEVNRNLADNVSLHNTRIPGSFKRSVHQGIQRSKDDSDTSLDQLSFFKTRFR